MIESHVDQRELEAIKARYGIGGRTAGPGPFPIVLIKPSHYDSDGYVIQWWRPGPSTDTLARLRDLFDKFRQRKALGDAVHLEVRTIEEESTRVRTDRLARELRDGKGLVVLTGVQSRQFPRAMDLALPLRVTGVHVCMGGFHIARSLTAAGGVTPELQEAMNLGVSLYAGEVEEDRLERVLRDAWRGELKPLYNYLGDTPAGERAPEPLLGPNPVRGMIGIPAGLDATRRHPQQQSVSTLVVVPHQEPRRRTPDELDRLIREHVDRGAVRFFIADDNLAEHPGWEQIFDRLIAMREQQKLNIELTVQVDTCCNRRPGFIEKAGRAGVRRVFIGIERLSAGSPGAETQCCLAEYQSMLLEWKRAGVIVFAGYVFGFPGDTRQSVLDDIRTIQQELAVDLLEPYCLATLPRAESQAHQNGADAAMTAAEGEPLCLDAWRGYYTLEHMETVLRRAAGTGVDLHQLTALLRWFHFCVVYEKVDPLQGGWLRRKHRTDRRATMAKEKFFRFYFRYAAELLYKQVKMAQVSRRLRALANRLERQRGASPGS